MLVPPKTLPPNILITDIPNTKPCRVLQLAHTTIFGVPNSVVMLADPDDTLRTSLMLVPDVIPTLDICVSDGKHGHRFKKATLLVIGIDTPGALNLIWSCETENHSKIPVVTA